MNASPNGTSPAAPAGVTMGPHRRIGAMRTQCLSVSTACIFSKSVNHLCQSQAQADASKANSDYLQRTFKRNSELFYQGRGVISKQDLDTAQSQAETSVATYKANLAAVNVAKENLKVAHAQEGAARAQTEAALAQVKNSELQLSYCTVVAPVSGRIAQKTVQTGNCVSVGQALMAVVEDNVWIEANFKAVRDKIVPGLSTVPSIAVTQPLIDKPYPEAPENEKPSHQLANEPITQVRGVPATGVMP
jgi:acetyl/propionyl-CoA carboxylase alpha subunit